MMYVYNTIEIYKVICKIDNGELNSSSRTPPWPISLNIKKQCKYCQ